MKTQLLIPTLIFFLINLFFSNVFAETPVRKSVETRKVDLDRDRENNMSNAEMKEYQKSKKILFDSASL